MNILLKSSLIGFIFFNISCSTLSFIPREGGAAKFNIATVDYVNSSAAGQKEELMKNIKEDLDEILNSLLEEDRTALKNLETLLAEQEKRLTDIETSVETSNTSLGLLSSKLVKDLSEVKSTTRNMQMYVDQVEENLKTIPIEALKELSTALEEYMDKGTQDN